MMSGMVEALEGIVLDISDRKEVEENLRYIMSVILGQVYIIASAWRRFWTEMLE